MLVPRLAGSFPALRPACRRFFIIGDALEAGPKRAARVVLVLQLDIVHDSLEALLTEREDSESFLPPKAAVRWHHLDEAAATRSFHLPDNR